MDFSHCQQGNVQDAGRNDPFSRFRSDASNKARTREWDIEDSADFAH